MTIKPLGERALLEPVQKLNQTKGGIYIPDSAESAKKEGIIVSLGTKHENLTKGDKVLYSGYSNEEFEIDGKSYIIVEIKNIIATISEDNP